MLVKEENEECGIRGKKVTEEKERAVTVNLEHKRRKRQDNKGTKLGHIQKTRSLGHKLIK